MNIKNQAVSGVKWSAVLTVFTNALKFLQLLLLSRLLSPSDFGLMGMVMVVLQVFGVFIDVGVNEAIIYRQDINKEELSSLYWFNIIMSIVIFIAIMMVSPLVVIFYKEPRLYGLFFWMALTFIIFSFVQQFYTLHRKELLFDKLAEMEILSATSEFVVVIAAAFLKQGVYSLVWGKFADIITKEVMLANSGWKKWRPTLHFKIGELKKFINFGIYQSGQRLVNIFSANIDYIIIGKYLGVEILGIYTLAYKLITYPITSINPIINRVSYPVFSKLQNNIKMLQKAFLEAIKITSFISFPILIGLAVTAPLAVPVLFGEKWKASVLIVQILAFLGILKVAGNSGGSVILAKGRADIAFWWNVSIAITNTIAFYFAVFYGVYALSWVNLVLNIIYFFIYQSILVYIVELKLINVLEILKCPFLLSAWMGTMVLFLNFILLYMPIPSNIILGILVSFAALFYTLVFYFFQNSYFYEIVNLLKNIR